MADDTEKVSINVSAMDLANIDLLVEKTLYKDRTDFFRTAIRNQVDKHSFIIENTMRDYNDQKVMSKKLAFWVGSYTLNKKEIDEMVDLNKIIELIEEEKQRDKFKIIVFGKLVISNEVSLEYISRYVSSIKVFGIFRASQDIKDFYAN